MSQNCGVRAASPSLVMLGCSVAPRPDGSRRLSSGWGLRRRSLPVARPAPSLAVGLRRADRLWGQDQDRDSPSCCQFSTACAMAGPATDDGEVRRAVRASALTAAPAAASGPRLLDGESSLPGHSGQHDPAVFPGACLSWFSSRSLWGHNGQEIAAMISSSTGSTTGACGEAAATSAAATA